DAPRMLERRVLLRRLAVLERRAVAAVPGRLAQVRPHLALAGRAVDGHAGVLPGRVLVVGLLVLPAGEEAVQLLGVLEALVDDHRRVRVVHDVIADLAPVLEDVVDDPAEEGDVGAGPDAHVVGRGGARAGVAGVDVDYAGAALTRLHHPLIADRVALG